MCKFPRSPPFTFHPSHSDRLSVIGLFCTLICKVQFPCNPMPFMARPRNKIKTIIITTTATTIKKGQTFSRYPVSAQSPQISMYPEKGD